MSTWTVQIDYGSGVVSLTNFGGDDLVRDSSFSKTETLHKDLKPVQDKCNFTVDYKLSLFSDLLTLDSEQIILVDIDKDGADWFTGYARPVSSFTVNDDRTVDIEALDNSYKLKKKPPQLQKYTNQTVTQLVDAILTEAGYSVAERASIPTISTNVPYFSYKSDKREYWDILHELLYGYGYVFYFDESGAFRAHNWKADIVATSGSFGDNSFLDQLEVSRDDTEYDTVKAYYYRTKSARKQLVYRSVGGGVPYWNRDPGDEGVLTSGQTYPTATTHFFDDGEEDAEVIYIDSYRFGVLNIAERADGFSLPYPKFWTEALPIATPRNSLTTLTVNENDGSAQIEFTNDGTYQTVYVGTYVLTGVVFYREKNGFAVAPNTATENRLLEQELKHVYSSTIADQFATAMYRRFQNSVYRYRFSSETEADIGDYVTLTNTDLNINTTVRVVDKKYNERFDVDIWDYECEGVTAIGSLFNAITSATYFVSPGTADLSYAVDAATTGLTPSGQVTQPIDVALFSDASFSPNQDGLFITSTNLGFWDNTTETWPVRIYNDSGVGKFKVGDATKYVEWDGSNLNVKGNIDADTGTIGGWLIGTDADQALKSAASGARIDLNPADQRISVFDASGPVVAMGYLEGLSDPANRANPLGSTVFGFWSEDGNSVDMYGDVRVDSGSLSLEDNAAIAFVDGEGFEQMRLGSLTSGKIGIDIGGATFGATLGGGAATGTFDATLGGGAATGTFGTILGGGTATFGTGLTYDSIDDLLRLSGDIETGGDVSVQGSLTVAGVAHDAPPVGATYIQFPGKSSPNTLWPATTWTQLFNSEGVFFRTEGGEASAFESGIQEDELESHSHDTGEYLPGVGAGTQTAIDQTIQTSTFFNTQATGGAETRPRNRTIRVWERTA